MDVWCCPFPLVLAIRLYRALELLCYIYSEVIAVTGSAISPKLQIKCFLKSILLLIFSGRTKNNENITLVHKKRDFKETQFEYWYMQSLF